DGTGHALPQDALIVAQPPPGHVCGSWIDRTGLDDLADFSAFDLCLPDTCLSSAGFSDFFSAAVSVLAGGFAEAGADAIFFSAAAGFCSVFASDLGAGFGSDFVSTLASVLASDLVTASTFAASGFASTEAVGRSAGPASAIRSVGRGRGNGISSSDDGTSSRGASMTNLP